ncbi:single-stranded DNA-binding protein [Larkinella arboricola]|uniref:Single-stranded DNA-binding protein n=1 Tax=Larkinella arboricola TaxID=643671 RepID=A0A327X7E6_LARAB|nr:single-stranded DNA-binding protein [Larkinella arboricola]RAK02917.1 single-strand DNA-binding protein [Larkinella arboricola]
MASMNKVILIGNVGNDPEVRYLDGGSVVAKFSVATNERYTTRTGEQVDQTEWFRVEVWNDQAKTVEKYVRKGNQIYVEGRLKTETYTDREGKERFSLTVRATTFQFLGSRQDGSDGGDYQEPAPRQQAAPQAAPAPAPRQAAPQPAPARQAAPQAAPAARKPEPVPDDMSNAGDDDLPF